MSSPSLPLAVPVTRGPRHHWFGYHDLCPWDGSGRYLLAAEADFQDREPRPGERCRLGVIDLRQEGSFEAFAETSAWSWQVGARLQWRGPKYSDEVVYNAVEAERLVAIVHNLKQGSRRVLPRPVHSLATDGETALTVNFARIADCRPGYGHAAVPDPGAHDLAPRDDGLWRMAVDTGATDLLVSLEALTGHEPHRTMAEAKHWVSDPRFSPDGSRFVFLHRWVDPTGRLRCHRLLTARPDGSELTVVCDYQMVSHFDWFDNERVLVWARQLDLGDHFYLFHVTSGKRETVGLSTLTEDGHCSFSPDRRWIVSDTYPDENNERELVLYKPTEDLLLTMGRFYADPNINGEFRCDLHPRWSRDGKRLCFDSIHEGSRQVYALDVSRIVGR